MNDDRTLERAAREWLEIGPTRAPDRPVQAALEIIEAMPQERSWPRALDRIGTWHAQRVLSAAAVVAAVVLGGLMLALRLDPGPGPAISPSPSPSTSIPPSQSPVPVSSSLEVAPPVLTATFTSPRNGFSIQYPGDWVVVPATARWEPGATNLWGSAALDELRGSTVRFAGTSQALATGQTPEEWLAAYATGSCLGDPSNWPAIQIGSATGYITADGCEVPGPPVGKGGQIFDAVAVVGGRAYNFTMDGELTPSDFVAVLAAVTLDPASAVDASPAP